MIRSSRDTLAELDLARVRLLTSREVAGILDCAKSGKKIRIVHSNQVIRETLKAFGLEAEFEFHL